MLAITNKTGWCIEIHQHHKVEGVKTGAYIHPQAELPESLFSPSFDCVAWMEPAMRSCNHCQRAKLSSPIANTQHRKSLHQELPDSTPLSGRRKVVTVRSIEVLAIILISTAKPPGVNALVASAKPSHESKSQLYHYNIPPHCTHDTITATKIK